MNEVPDAATFVAIARHRARTTPGRVAFEYETSDGDVQTIDYAALDRNARSVAALIQRRCASGDRVLLLHAPGLAYVTAFLGCLYAGAVAVPMYPPTDAHGAERMQIVAGDCDAKLALTDEASLAAVGGGAAGPLPLAASDGLDPASAADWTEHTPDQGDLAFLQYTSGSTGAPKGVMISHGNLTHNSAVIAAALGLSAASRAVSWLPPYHDMGLIGGILQPLFTGFPCTLLSPWTFLRAPLRWLKALSRTRATITAAPDFAFAEVVRRTTAEERAAIDLSALRHTLVGAEPVRLPTLDGFAAAMSDSGFDRASFYPCYGLAEATLFVSGAADPRSGPTSVDLDRAALEAGRAVAAEPDDRRTIGLTGCGVPHGADVTVVDPESGRRLPPDGSVGEIWVSGPTVARGYWRLPEETEDAFGAHSADDPVIRWLRTGDLGFWHDGELFIAGRLKDLIVVRGRNHHPHDIEQTAEQAHPLLRPGRSAAFAADDGTGERVVLVHEVRGGCTDEMVPAVTAAVREAVAGKHGLRLDHVVLVGPGHVPRTSSGKIRRAECRARWTTGELGGVRTGPEPVDSVPPAEDPGLPEVIEHVAACLDVPAADVAPDMTLTAQGLDSLRAVQLAEELRRSGIADIDVPTLLDGATPLRLAAICGDADAAPPQPPAPPDETADSATRPATASQERFWLLDRMGAGPAYHLSAGVRFTGPLDVARLERCVRALVDGAPALRTVFAVDDDGIVRRSRIPASRFPLRSSTLADLPEAERADASLAEIRALATEPFDLATGPLVRFLLVRLGEDDWRLGIAAHHIVLDGWSLGILLRRLGDLYRSSDTEMSELPRLPEAGTGTAPDDAASIAFWRAELAGAAPTGLDIDLPRGGEPAWRGASVPVTLSAELADRVRAFAAQRSVTPFAVLLTAFGVLLARWTGHDEPVIGTVASGRDRRGVPDVVGPLADTLPIRLDLRTGDVTSFTCAVDRTSDRHLAASRHAGLPFDRIVRTVNARAADGRAALVRTLFALQNLPLEPWRAGALRAEPFELPSPGAQFELALHLTPQPDGTLAGHVVYSTELFTAMTVESLIGGLPVLLDAALGQPGMPLSALPIVSAAEADRIVRAGNGGDAAAAPALVHDKIASVARERPDDTAVVWDDGSLSYGALMERASALAARLSAAGAGPDRPIAICLDRSPELIVAVLAALLSGGAYLPLDPGHPPTRTAGQVRDARAVALVHAGPGPLLDALDGRIESIDVRATAPSASATSIDRPSGHPDQLANVLYTSGSTGAPKGVTTTHRALVNQMAWMQREFPLRRGERVLHKTPVTFDVAGWELLWPLMTGATIVPAKPGGHHDPHYLAGLIRRHEVTTCHFVPSMLHVFLEEPAVAGCRSVRRVICTGEELPPRTAERLRHVLPDARLNNMYGPTEAAIAVSAQNVEPGHERALRVPIGRPMAGARLYVLDRAGRPVPRRAPGELYIGGTTTARGYLGRPGTTADRFVPDPFTPGARLYRTGDAARALDDGVFDYLGRLDRQLKLRGQRIEPGEIEAVLTAHPKVGSAAVDVRPGPAGRQCLVAWVVPRDIDRPDHAELSAYLKEHLPPAMVPEATTVLDRLPVGTHGKLDRGALPEPELTAGSVDGERIAPRTAVERRLAEIWADTLGGAPPSVTDDFFDSGGHSLLATRIAVRVRAVFGVDLPVGDLIGMRLTIERLAVLVQDLQLAQADPETVESAVDWISGLSDAEVRDLLTAGYAAGGEPSAAPGEAAC